MSACTAIFATVVATSTAVFASNVLEIQQQHQQHQQQQPRILTLTNSESGTIIIHPLIPHKAHLDRHRRELNENHININTPYTSFTPYNDSNDRPHTSRHSNGKEQRQRSLQEQQMQMDINLVPHQGYSTHYVDLFLGSPTRQRQTLIVDTASSVTAFPCEQCAYYGCGGIGNQYQQSQY